MFSSSNYSNISTITATARTFLTLCFLSRLLLYDDRQLRKNSQEQELLVFSYQYTYFILLQIMNRSFVSIDKHFDFA